MASGFVTHQDRGGCTVEDFCNHIHRSLLKDVKYVLVWGVSARHYPQHCGTSHGLQDEDVVQIVKKKVSSTCHRPSSSHLKKTSMCGVYTMFFLVLVQVYFGAYQLCCDVQLFRKRMRAGEAVSSHTPMHLIGYPTG